MDSSIRYIAHWKLNDTNLYLKNSRPQRPDRPLICDLQPNEDQWDFPLIIMTTSMITGGNV